MSNRIVLIPFVEAVSFGHLLSTRGGNRLPSTQTMFEKTEALYNNYVNQLSQNKLSTNVSAYKNSQNLKMQKIGDTLELLKSNYDAAKADRDQAIQRGWNKIDPNDVVCSDSITLVSALSKLQSADDTLYIRGHCLPGDDELASSDRSKTISVNGLIDILDGGLDKKFPGKIKVYACQSSKDTVDSKSFAKRFATKLSKRGWINCSFYGYNENLKTFISDASGHKMTERGSRASDSRDFIQVPTKHTDSGCLIS
jgi:hypothetical protein